MSVSVCVHVYACVDMEPEDIGCSASPLYPTPLRRGSESRFVASEIPHYSSLCLSPCSGAAGVWDHTRFLCRWWLFESHYACTVSAPTH